MKQLLAIIGFIATTATPAQAEEPTAGMLGFGGYKAKALHKSVRGQLQHVVRLVSFEEVMESADQLGADVNTEEGLMVVAESMGLELFVRARVRGKGRRARTKIMIIGPDGSVMKTVKGRSPKSKRGRKKIARRTANAVAKALRQLERIDRALAAEEAEDEDMDDVDGEEELDITLEDETPKTSRVVLSAAAAEEEPEEEEEEAKPLWTRPDRETASPKKSKPATIQPKPDEDRPLRAGAKIDRKKKGVQRHIIAASAGFTVRARSARIQLTDGRSATHSTGAFPEIYGAVEARPFKDGLLRGLFGTVDLGVEVGLSSIAATDDVETSALRVSGTVGYLYDVGLLELGGGVGFGLDRMALSENDVLDSSTYSYVRIALFGRLSLLEDKLAIDVSGGVRPVISTGGFGALWEQGSAALGYEVTGGVTGQTEVGFLYGASVGYAGYSLRFSNTERIGATGGRDGNLLITLRAGWAF